MHFLSKKKLPQLVALPQWNQQAATTLQEMAIVECPNLTALPDWLPNFVSLSKLGIVSCHKLLSLPMGSLTALRLFGVADCPELIRRCQPEIGEDWLKIALASDICIDGKRLISWSQDMD